MKSKDIKSLQQKSSQELRKELLDKKQKLARLRLERSVNPMKNTRSLIRASDEIAVISTILNSVSQKEQKKV